MFEEPYALMRARTGLWERGAGNSPSPPGQAQIFGVSFSGGLSVKLPKN
jgi:hypothetical protein